MTQRWARGGRILRRNAIAAMTRQQPIIYAPNISFRYHRLYITALATGATEIILQEAEFLINGTDQVPTLSGNSSAAPIVVSASAIFSSTYDAWKAFDDTTGGTGWDTNSGAIPGWLQVDWGSGNYKVLNGLSMTPLGNLYAPSTFKVQGSNDATNWTDLYSRTGETGWGSNEKRTFTF